MTKKTVHSNLVTDLVIVHGHAFVDDDAWEVSTEGHRKRIERGEVLHRLGPHQLEDGEAVAFWHPKVERIDTGSFHLDQQTL